MEEQERPDITPGSYNILKDHDHFLQIRTPAGKKYTMKRYKFAKEEEIANYQTEFNLQRKNLENVSESLNFFIDLEKKEVHNCIRLIETNLEELAKLRSKQRKEKIEKFKALKKEVPYYETTLDIDELKQLMKSIINGTFLIPK